MSKQANDTQQVQESLRNSVAKALDRKRRLGQYAVVWRGGRPVRIEPDENGNWVQQTDIPRADRNDTEHNTSEQDKP